MAYQKKTWKDRLVEFATRRVLTDASTSETQIVEVARSEGTVYQPGDAFSAENMNDLEDRIDAEFSTLNENLTGKLGFVDYANSTSYTPRNHTTAQTAIEAPYDGFMVITNGYPSNGNFAGISVFFVKNDNTLVFIGTATTHSGFCNSFSLFVKQGQRFVFNSAEAGWGTNDNATLFPFIA